jgi:predicted PurR-regulated permease PerM
MGAPLIGARSRAGTETALPPWFRRAVVFVLGAWTVLQAGGWLLSNLRGFLGLVFLAWMFSISMEPVVGRLVRRGLRRGLATGVVMLGLALGLAAFVGIFGALLVDQLRELVTSAPGVINDVVDWANGVFGTTFRPEDVTDSLQLTPERTQDLARELAPGLFGILSSLVGMLFQAFTLALFTFYMSAQAPQLRRTVSSWFPPRQQRVISTVWEIAVDKTGSYVVSKVILAALSTFFTGIFFWAIGIPFWLPLAIWTGLVSQFIPTVGTYVAIAIPALIALARDPADGLWVVLFGTVYQQVENYLFSPRITSRTMSIHPAVGFGAAVVGATLFGAFGALVSVPVVAAIAALIDTYGHRYELVGSEEEGEAAGSRPATDVPA